MPRRKPSKRPRLRRDNALRRVVAQAALAVPVLVALVVGCAAGLVASLDKVAPAAPAAGSEVVAAQADLVVPEDLAARVGAVVALVDPVADRPCRQISIPSIAASIVLTRWLRG
jgi:hypothetical protein